MKRLLHIREKLNDQKKLPRPPIYPSARPPAHPFTQLK